MRLPFLLALALAPVALAASDAATVRVSEEGGEASYRFDPANVTVASGGTLRVVGGPIEPHTFTHDAPRDERLFDSGNVDAGATVDVALPPVGAYAFLCLYHPGMRGTLVVEAARDAPAATPVAAGLALVALALVALAWGRR